MNKSAIKQHQRQKRGPRSYMPDGRRFSVVGRHVSWQGWSFYFNIRSTTGPQLFEVRFRDRRLVYELSLQELVTLHSGASPSTQFTTIMQSVNQLGNLAYEMFHGVDCPDESVYFDSVHYVRFRPAVYRNSACLFERNGHVPLRRHRRRDPTGILGGEEAVSGMPDNVLVLRAVIITSNYDYIVDYIFHQNAILEVACSISGYIQTRFYTGNEDNKYGFQVTVSVI